MIRLLSVMVLLVGLFAVAAPVPKGHPWVTARGRVVWPKGQPIPEPKVVPVTIDKQACRAGKLLSDELLVDSKSRGVKNVVVWLRPDSDDRKATFPTDRVHPDLAKPKPAKHVINMPMCQFVPRVFAARAGDTWEFKNEGIVATNVRVQHDDPLFNVLLPAKKGYVAREALRESWKPVYFKSDVHPWMAGVGRVFDHPYFAVTDADGHFELKQVPKGNWRIMYWHELGYHKGRDGALGFPLAVSGETATVTAKAVPLELPSR